MSELEKVMGLIASSGLRSDATDALYWLTFGWRGARNFPTDEVTVWAQVDVIKAIMQRWETEAIDSESCR